MMRAPAILLVLLCGLTAANAQSKKLIRTYGIVSKTETSVKYKDGAESNRYISEKENYDENGEWIEYIDYNSKGKIKSQETRTYVKGILVAEMKDIKIPKSEGKISYNRSTFQYVKGNVVMKETFNLQDELVKRTTYAYNKFGDLELEVKMNGTGEIKKRISYVYDNRGLKTEKTVTDVDGLTLEIKLYAYE